MESVDLISIKNVRVKKFWFKIEKNVGLCLFVLIINFKQKKKIKICRTSKASASGLDPEMEATAGTMNDSKYKLYNFYCALWTVLKL